MAVSWGAYLAKREDKCTGPGAEDPGADVGPGHHFLIETPSPTEPEGARLALAALTTVLLVRVILTIVVAVTHPGTADALAVVTVKVKRGAGGQHWVRGKKKRESARYASPGRLSRARKPFLTPLFQVSHLNHSPSSDSCACPPPADETLSRNCSKEVRVVAGHGGEIHRAEQPEELKTTRKAVRKT